MSVWRTSFNEAPIHESGKCGTLQTCRTPRIGFNEAPIHESGKYHQRINRYRRMERLQ